MRCRLYWVAVRERSVENEVLRTWVHAARIPTIPVDLFLRHAVRDALVAEKEAPPPPHGLRQCAAQLSSVSVARTLYATRTTYVRQRQRSNALVMTQSSTATI